MASMKFTRPPVCAAALALALSSIPAQPAAAAPAPAAAVKQKAVEKVEAYCSGSFFNAFRCYSNFEQLKALFGL